jgi:hypothetical protein
MNDRDRDAADDWMWEHIPGPDEFSLEDNDERGCEPWFHFLRGRDSAMVVFRIRVKVGQVVSVNEEVFVDEDVFGIKAFGSNTLFAGTSAPGDANAKEDARGPGWIRILRGFGSASTCERPGRNARGDGATLEDSESSSLRMARGHPLGLWTSFASASNSTPIQWPLTQTPSCPMLETRGRDWPYLLDSYLRR